MTRLYHGSNVAIEEIDLSRSKRGKDFGQGFYLNANPNQAKVMAIRTTRFLNEGQPTLSCFEMDVLFSDEDFWLTQNQLAELYNTTQQNIALHIKNIYSAAELTDSEATHKDFLLVRQEGNRKVKRNLTHYNLDMIIALGHRIQSDVATRFCIWAREQLEENGRNCDLVSQTSLSPEEKECIKDRNGRYWKAMTAKASETYKNRMRRLSSAETDEERRLLKSFRRDNSFLGTPALHHIMYKLGDPLQSKDGQRAYEFLIEYDIYEPMVGIYYGCKGLILKGDYDQQIRTFINEWEEIKSKLAYVLTTTFPGKEFLPRFRQTNNANNNTYWPFWITLYEEEDIVGVAARAIRIIRDVYQRRFDLQETTKVITPTPECANDDKKKELVKYERERVCFNTITAFTELAYQNLLGKLGNDTGRMMFEKLINSLMHDKSIHIVDGYEKAYAIDRDGTEFAYLIVAFIDHLKMHGCKISPPWAAISNVFLNKDEKCFGEAGLKNLYKPRNDETTSIHKKHVTKSKEELLNML